MQARFFVIDTSQLPATTPNSPVAQTLNVPGLSAYSIDHADLQNNGIANPVDGTAFSISGDIINCVNSQLEQTDNLRLAVYHFGIKDYSLLFPQVRAADLDRAIRMGKFYEESEKAFDEEAWLSYMLMCGAIFEHLLYFKLGCPSSAKTINKVAAMALSQSVITSSEHDIVDYTRRARNVIHCNNMSDDYISRSEAMDARTAIEKLMLRI